MLPYSHDPLDFPLPNDPSPSSSSPPSVSTLLGSSDDAMASPDPKTGSNLPPSLWLPLLSIAFACVMFVSFRRAGASGIFRGEDSLLSTSLRRLRRFVDEKRGRGVYLPTSDSPSSSHPYALSPTTPASASATPLSSPLFPRIVVSPSSPNKEAKFGLSDPDDDDGEDDEEEVLPLAWEADEIERQHQAREGGVLGFISGGQRRS